GHSPRLHPPSRAHEPDGRGGMAPGHECLGHSDGGEHVAGGPAPGHDGEGARRHQAVDAGARGRGGRPCRATLSSTPTANSRITSDEPPNDTKGSGTPVTGRMPITAPMFMK